MQPPRRQEVDPARARKNLVPVGRPPPARSLSMAAAVLSGERRHPYPDAAARCGLRQRDQARLARVAAASDPSTRIIPRLSDRVPERSAAWAIDLALPPPSAGREGYGEAAGIEPASAIARNERLQACPPPRSRPVPVAGAVRAPGQPHSGSPPTAEALSRRTSPLIDADPGPRAQLRSTARYLITQAAKARSVSDFAVLVSRVINEANRDPRLAVRPAQQTTSKPGRPRDSLSVPRARVAATVA